MPDRLPIPPAPALAAAAISTSQNDLSADYTGSPDANTYTFVYAYTPLAQYAGIGSVGGMTPGLGFALTGNIATGSVGNVQESVTIMFGGVSSNQFVTNHILGVFRKSADIGRFKIEATTGGFKVGGGSALIPYILAENGAIVTSESGINLKYH